MKKKPNFSAILLFLTCLICVACLLLFSYTTIKRIVTTDREVTQVLEQMEQRRRKVKEEEEVFTRTLEKVRGAVDYARQKTEAQSRGNQPERAPVEGNTPSKPSVFSQPDPADGNVFSSEGANGPVVGIDPGHQSERIDMSATEPNGPGSSEMKAQASAGTQGSYTKIPEYELNLQVSLKLKDILESRGYQVVMTRTDNDTAISNKERAQYAAEQGADIYVRIHANGEDSHSTSGALSMSPSDQNPYVGQLFEESELLSQCILDSYCQATGFSNLGVQYYDNMTGINWSSVPVTILEMGFMTNENDDRKMSEDAFRQTMAEGIANGIDTYFERTE